MVEKYKTAGNIANKAIAQVRNALKDGATVFELCEIGDKVMNDELALIYTSKKSRKILKGIAFPTSEMKRVRLRELW